MTMTLRLTPENEEMLKTVAIVDDESATAIMNKALELYFKQRMNDPEFRNKLRIKMLQLADYLKPFSEILKMEKVLNHPNHIRYTAGNHNDTASIWCEEHKRHEKLENQDVV